MDPPSKEESKSANLFQKTNQKASIPPPPPTYSVPRIESTRINKTKKEANLLHPKRQLNLNYGTKAHRLTRNIGKRRAFRPIKDAKPVRNVAVKTKFEVHKRHSEAKTPPPSNKLQEKISSAPAASCGRSRAHNPSRGRRFHAPRSFVNHTSSSHEVRKHRSVPEVDLLESAEALLSLRGF